MSEEQNVQEAEIVKEESTSIDEMPLDKRQKLFQAEMVLLAEKYHVDLNIAIVDTLKK